MRCYASFFRNRRAWMCRLSVLWQLPTGGVEKISGHPKKFSPLAGSYVKQSVLRFCCSLFRNGKGGKKNQSPKRGPCNSASYVKKVVLVAVFIFLGQDVPGCAILVFVGNPPVNPSKTSKSCFWMVFACFWQHVAKKSENQAAQKCSISYRVLCEKRAFEALQSVLRFCCSFFRNGKGGKKHNHPNVVHVLVPPM